MAGWRAGLGEAVDTIFNKGFDVYKTEKETAVSKKRMELQTEANIAASNARAEAAKSQAQASMFASETRRNMYIAIGIAVFAILVLIIYKARR